MRRNRRVGWVVMVVVGLVLGLAPATGSGAAPTASTESGSSDWRTVSAGNTHTCGIRTSGRLYCWGSDQNGQLGNAATTGEQPSPSLVAGGFTDWTAVSTGAFHTCAIRRGSLWCWGNDGQGQLGNGPLTGNQPAPVPVTGGAATWTSVTAGSFHTCGRRATGRLYCWGYDSHGQLGNGAPAGDQPAPVQVAGNRTDWASATAGGEHTCARRSTGRLWCWGSDSGGQLGNGATAGDRFAPTPVGSATDWTSVSAGAGHTCGRRASGRIWCWGADNFAQLGNGATTGNQPSPVQVAGNRTDWTSVVTGGTHTCARRTSGRLWCWGADGAGQLGDGGVNAGQPSPVPVAGSATDWTLVDGGSNHTCARTTSGRLYCWGQDDAGHLGDGGTDTNQPRPSEVFAP